MGGQDPSNLNLISYVTILTTGNAADFGDLNGTIKDGAAACNAQGGV